MLFRSGLEALVNPPPDTDVVRALNARLTYARLLDAQGRPASNVEQDQPIVLDAVLEAARELVDPVFALQIRNADGVIVWGSSWTLHATAVQGRQMALRGTIENRLVPGSYTLECWVRRDRESGDMALQGMQLARFVIYGTAPRAGMVSLRAEIEPTLEDAP